MVVLNAQIEGYQPTTLNIIVNIIDNVISDIYYYILLKSDVQNINCKMAEYYPK